MIIPTISKTVRDSPKQKAAGKARSVLKGFEAEEAGAPAVDELSRAAKGKKWARSRRRRRRRRRRIEEQTKEEGREMRRSEGQRNGWGLISHRPCRFMRCDSGQGWISYSSQPLSKLLRCQFSICPSFFTFYANTLVIYLFCSVLLLKRNFCCMAHVSSSQSIEVCIRYLGSDRGFAPPRPLQKKP